MPIPSSHMKERLSVAYVRAVTARAGAKLDWSDAPEYGVDGSIQKVVQLPNGRYSGTGIILQCQIKATINCRVAGDSIVYYMDANDYNKLAMWQGPTPCILILLQLPKDEEEWLAIDEESLSLRNCCYWAYINGHPTENTSKIKVSIPRNQTFTPESVQNLLVRVKEGRF